MKSASPTCLYPSLPFQQKSPFFLFPVLFLFHAPAPLSLSWLLAELLLSASADLGHCGGVGKEGGVRCSRFQVSWWGLLRPGRPGPSLGPNKLLAPEIKRKNHQLNRPLSSSVEVLHTQTERLKVYSSFFYKWGNEACFWGQRTNEWPGGAKSYEKQNVPKEILFQYNQFH